MGCSHSTPAPTEEDWAFVHGPPPLAFLCDSLAPKNAPSDTYYFSLQKNSWNKETSIQIHDEQLILTPSTDENGVVLLLQRSGDGSTNDDDDEPIVTIAVLKLDTDKLMVNVYSFQPAIPHQSPSNQQYQGHPLYKWATITKRKASRQCIMTTTSLNDTIHYTTDFYGTPLFGSRKLVLKRQGLYCASLERSSSTYAYKCGVAPGVDPLLVVCFVTSMDKIHWCEQKSLEAKHHHTSYRTSNVM